MTRAEENLALIKQLADLVLSLVEDDAYGAGWDADTTHAPSQNAVYDKIEAILAGGSNMCRVATGTYTGDGGGSAASWVDAQQITGLGFTPTYVRIIESGGVLATYEFITGMTATYCYIYDETAFWVTYRLVIISDGFEVNDHAADYGPNKNGVVYYYAAFG